MNKEDLLNGYFENSLSNEEKKVFEDLLKNDAEFKEEFELRKDLKSALQQNKRKELKEKLKEYEARKPKERSLVFNWRYVAAAVLVLGFGTYFLVNDFQNTEDLYSAYYETYPNTVLPVVRADSTEESPETLAFQAYENEDHERAIDLFSSIYETSHAEYALFYKAMSILDKGEATQEAIRILQNTEWSDDYKDKSLWYLALAYLKQDNKPKAKLVLEKLKNESNYRNQQVSELLGKL